MRARVARPLVRIAGAADPPRHGVGAHRNALERLAPAHGPGHHVGQSVTGLPGPGLVGLDTHPGVDVAGAGEQEDGGTRGPTVLELALRVSGVVRGDRQALRAEDHGVNAVVEEHGAAGPVGAVHAQGEQRGVEEARVAALGVAPLVLPSASLPLDAAVGSELASLGSHGAQGRGLQVPEGLDRHRGERGLQALHVEPVDLGRIGAAEHGGRTGVRVGAGDSDRAPEPRPVLAAIRLRMRLVSARRRPRKSPTTRTQLAWPSEQAIASARRGWATEVETRGL